MGTLTPGADYVYEYHGQEIYAREAGKTEKKLVGHRYENAVDSRTSDGRPLYEHIQEDKLWGEIRRTAKNNPTLQEAIERVKIIYYLSNEYTSRHNN
jgi:hypothetical protein